MPLYTSLESLSTTPEANAADGAVDAPSTVDEQLNLLASFIAQMRDTYATGQALSGKVGDSGAIVFRNRVINGGFSVNQRGVSGTVTLAPGAHGHDRWKAGSTGCTYTFATVAGVTTITIVSGTLVQVVEGANIEGGIYCLSWTGTATGRIGAGTFSASGVNSTSQTGGANLNVEFATGTLTAAQLEPGTLPTPTERRPIGLELSLCKRYYQVLQCGFQGQVIAGSGYGGTVNFPVEMRASPTLAFSGDIQIANFQTGTLALTNWRAQAVDYGKIANGNGAGVFSTLFTAVAEL